MLTLAGGRHETAKRRRCVRGYRGGRERGRAAGKTGANHVVIRSDYELKSWSVPDFPNQANETLLMARTRALRAKSYKSALCE